MINGNHQVFSTVSVIGLGYIGLPTAALFASKKCHVIGVDINPAAVEAINKGEIHFVEPELDRVVHEVVSAGYLRASFQPEAADAYLIAVPTPFKENHTPDLSYIEAASRSIAPHLKRGSLVVLESTSPVGATEQLCSWLADLRQDLTFPLSHGEASDVRIAYCPERVLPGQVLNELINNDRIIGGLTSKCSDQAVALYEIFVKGKCIVTHSRTAEMCKLTENSFRDVNIAFANELSLICDRLDINVWELIQLANHHPRVNILQPGPGVGGHCIAVDPWFIVSSSPQEAKLIATARQVNDHKPNWIIEKVKLSIDCFLKQNPGKKASDVTIACFGLAFKANIDDLRESPALYITKEIAKMHSGHVIAVEPFIDTLPNGLSTLIELHDTKQALAESDIVVLLVDHTIFKNISNLISANQIVIDTRGIFFNNSSC